MKPVDELILRVKAFTSTTSSGTIIAIRITSSMAHPRTLECTTDETITSQDGIKWCQAVNCTSKYAGSRPFWDVNTRSCHPLRLAIEPTASQGDRTECLPGFLCPPPPQRSTSAPYIPGNDSPPALLPTSHALRPLTSGAPDFSPLPNSYPLAGYPSGNGESSSTSGTIVASSAVSVVAILVVIALLCCCCCCCLKRFARSRSSSSSGGVNKHRECTACDAALELGDQCLTGCFNATSQLTTHLFPKNKIDNDNKLKPPTGIASTQAITAAVEAPENHHIRLPSGVQSNPPCIVVMAPLHGRGGGELHHYQVQNGRGRDHGDTPNAQSGTGAITIARLAESTMVSTHTPAAANPCATGGAPQRVQFEEGAPFVWVRQEGAPVSYSTEGDVRRGSQVVLLASRDELQSLQSTRFLPDGLPVKERGGISLCIADDTRHHALGDHQGGVCRGLGDSECLAAMTPHQQQRVAPHQYPIMDGQACYGKMTISNGTSCAHSDHLSLAVHEFKGSMMIQNNENLSQACGMLVDEIGGRKLPNLTHSSCSASDTAEGESSGYVQERRLPVTLPSQQVHGDRTDRYTVAPAVQPSVLLHPAPVHRAVPGGPYNGVCDHLHHAGQQPESSHLLSPPTVGGTASELVVLELS